MKIGIDMRINKYLASCGIASRRKAEEIILAKRVKVNGEICTNLSTEISENDKVLVDNKSVHISPKMIYIMLNKPKGYICSAKDDKGRKTVLDLVDTKERVFSVGRLDYDSEGLLLLTNDGDLTYKLTHPKNNIDKTYDVVIESEISDAELAILKKGVVIDGYKLKSPNIKVISNQPKRAEMTVVIHEGRNREIRKMFECINKNVIFLKRTKIANLELGKLKRGCYRPLLQTEIDYLKSL